MHHMTQLEQNGNLGPARFVLFYGVAILLWLIGRISVFGGLCCIQNKVYSRYNSRAEDVCVFIPILVIHSKTCMSSADL